MKNNKVKGFLSLLVLLVAVGLFVGRGHGGHGLQIAAKSAELQH